MICEARFLDHLPGGVYSLTRDVLPRLLDAGERIFGFVHEGYWQVLDTPADLERGRAEIGKRIALRSVD